MDKSVKFHYSIAGLRFVFSIRSRILFVILKGRWIDI
jgi:hypothetical protein